MADRNLPYPPLAAFQPYHNSNFNSFDNSNLEKYYNLETIPIPKRFTCEACSRSFYSNGQLKKHISEHVECPFPECRLMAHIKVIDQHISHQHMLINFEALQIDDETWIAERKKRFPTQQRAELRRAQQMERFKRGERLGKDSKKFAKGKPFPRVRESGDYQRINKKEPRGSKLQKFNQFYKSEVLITSPLIADLYDSDSECKRGISAFKGTKSFLESTGEISLFGLKHDTSEKYSEIDISDDEDWNLNLSSIGMQENKSQVLHNALGSLIGAYNSGSESDENCSVKDASALSNYKNDKNTDKTIPINPQNGFTHSSDNMLTNQVVKDTKASEEENTKAKNYINNRKRKRNTVLGRNEKEESNKSGFKGPMYYRRRRRLTLLQKLLQPDITHERNIILQCIRYIIDNDYFDQNTQPKTEAENSTKC